MSAGNFTPVSELAGHKTERIHWSAELPDYAPAEAIGVDIERLGKLARLGGCNQVTITSGGGDVTEMMPGVSSVDEHGSATATMSATIVKAELTQLQRGEAPDAFARRHYDYFWPNVTMKLNLSEITDRLSASKKPGALRQPAAWADQINKAMKQGFRRVARENLLINAPLGYKLSPFVCEGFLAGCGELFFGNNAADVLSYMAATTAAVQFALEPFDLSRRHGLPISERRWSFIPGLQADRVLAVNGLTRTLKLAKSLR